MLFEHPVHEINLAGKSSPFGNDRDSYQAGLEMALVNRGGTLDKFVTVAKEAARGYASVEQIESIPDRLRNWLEDSLIEVDGMLQLAEPRNVVWAFLAWEPR